MKHRSGILAFLGILIFLAGGFTWWLISDPDITVRSGSGAKSTTHEGGKSLPGAISKRGRPEERSGETPDIERKEDKQQPAPEGDCRVSGRVLTSGNPAAGVSVGARYIDERMEPAGRFRVSQVQTGDDGRFEISGLSCERYLLSAQSENTYGDAVLVSFSRPQEHREVELSLAPGVALTMGIFSKADKSPIEGARVVFSDFTSGHESSKLSDADGKVTFTGLRPGQHIVDVERRGYAQHQITFIIQDVAKDYGDIFLEPAQSVFGRVVSGGQPVAGAKVTLGQDYRTTLVITNPQREAQTDEGGYFSIQEVAAGQYMLTVEADGFASAKLSNVRVEKGQDTELPDIALSAGIELDGKVVDAQDKPVADAMIMLSVKRKIDGEFIYNNDVRTDAEGAFHLSDLMPGVLEAAVYGKGRLPIAKQIEIVAGQEHAEIVLKFEGALAIAGKVVNSRNEPVSGAFVAISGPGSDDSIVHALEGETARTQTDSAGRFSFEGLKSKSYTLLAGHPQSFNAAGGNVDRIVEAGDRNVIIQLPDPGSIAGTVRFEDGAFPSSFSVALSAHGLPKNFSGGDGRFELTDVPPGNYWLVVAGQGIVETKSDMVSLEQGMRIDDLEIVVSRLGGLKGRVVDEQTGEPIIDAGLQVLSIENRFSGGEVYTTNLDGGYFMPALKPGTYQLKVEVRDYRPKTIDGVEVAPGEIRELEPIRLSRGLSFSGIVVDTSGTPLPGVSVQAADYLAGSSLANTVTDQNGRFSLSGLREKDYVLLFSLGLRDSASKTSWRKKVEVRRGQQPLEIVLPAGEASLLVSLGDEGKPSPYRAVWLFHGGLAAGDREEFQRAIQENTFAFGLTLEAGTVLFENIAAGQYSVMAFIDQVVDNRMVRDTVVKRVNVDASGRSEVVLEP